MCGAIFTVLYRTYSRARAYITQRYDNFAIYQNDKPYFDYKMGRKGG